MTTAPAHGADDFQVGQKYDLEVYNPVGGNGIHLDSTEHFRRPARDESQSGDRPDAGGEGVLLHAEQYEHAYPHCWRHKTPIISRHPQWFVSMSQNGLLLGRSPR